VHYRGDAIRPSRGVIARLTFGPPAVVCAMRHRHRLRSDVIARYRAFHGLHVESAMSDGSRVALELTSRSDRSHFRISALVVAGSAIGGVVCAVDTAAVGIPLGWSSRARGDVDSCRWRTRPHRGAATRRACGPHHAIAGASDRPGCERRRDAAISGKSHTCTAGISRTLGAAIDEFATVEE
jgi:hypothetical protein